MTAADEKRKQPWSLHPLAFMTEAELRSAEPLTCAEGDAVTLNFLAQQQARILAELAGVRADVRAVHRDLDMLTRIALRLGRRAEKTAADAP
jgi:hypothetical protein